MAVIRVKDFAEIKMLTDDPQLWARLPGEQRAYVLLANVVAELQALRDEVRTLRAQGGK